MLQHQLRTEWIGYFDSPDQRSPTYDPDDAAPCVWCLGPWTADTVRTISICAVEGSRSLFYRIHRACHDALTEEQKQFIDDEVAEMSLGRTRMEQMR